MHLGMRGVLLVTRSRVKLSHYAKTFPDDTLSANWALRLTKITRINHLRLNEDKNLENI